MHALGVSGALLGAMFLILTAPFAQDLNLSVALTIYAVTLMATFCASAFYHMTPWEDLRPVLRKIDHAAIYLKIAGTYTPLVVMAGSVLSYVVLAIVWLLAAFGMAQKLFFWRTPGPWGPAIPLIMGWLSIFLIWGLIPVIPPLGLGLIIAGGLTYSLGVIFFLWERLKFSNAIWHLFVLAGSISHYFMVVLL